MSGALVIVIVVFVLIVWEKVDRTIAAALGAAAVVFLGYIPYEEALYKIDLDVLFLLVGMMIMVNVLATTGFFEWMAVTIAQKAKGDALRILIGLLLCTAVLSAFLDNVTTVVLIAPITILITEILEIKTVPFLVLEAIFSNIGGTATLIGDPPNILVGAHAGFTFIDFLVTLGPLIALLLLIVIGLVPVFFGKSFQTTAETRARVMRAKPSRAIVAPDVLRKALTIFAMVLIAFCISHAFHLRPGFIALSGALVMVMVCRLDVAKVLEGVEWPVIFFLAGLFILIGGLAEQGFFEEVGDTLMTVLGAQPLLATLALLWLSAVLSAILGNIPVTIALIPLADALAQGLGEGLGLGEEPEVVRQTIANPLYWSLALGACLGGNGTVFGAAANIVVTQIAKRNKYRISFWEFTRYGLPVTVLTLVVCSFYLYLMHAFKMW